MEQEILSKKLEEIKKRVIEGAKSPNNDEKFIQLWNFDEFIKTINKVTYSFSSSPFLLTNYLN